MGLYIIVGFEEDRHNSKILVLSVFMTATNSKYFGVCDRIGAQNKIRC